MLGAGAQLNLNSGEGERSVERRAVYPTRTNPLSVHNLPINVRIGGLLSGSCCGTTSVSGSQLW
jgi:hypothetical protein